MRVTVSGNYELPNLNEDLKPIWGKVAKKLDSELHKHTKKHFKTGRLSRNIYTKLIKNGVEGGIDDQGMLVRTKRGRVNYGVFVNYGTKDHFIKPNKKKALRWVGANGRFAFSKGHKVKGIKASNFIQKSADATSRYAIKLIEDIL